MAQTLKSLSYEDVELFCEQTLHSDPPVTIERLLAEFPDDSIDVVSYFHQWWQDKLNKSLAASSQNLDSKPEIPPSITQILQEELAKLQVSQTKEQQALLVQQQNIEQFLITKSQELKTNLDNQSKALEDAYELLEQQSQEFQERLLQLTNDSNSKIDSLVQRHQQSLIAQQQQHQIAIENVIDENAGQIVILKEQVEQLTQDNSSLKVKAEQQLVNQKELSELQSTISHLEQQLIDEKDAQTQYIEVEKIQYEKSLNALRDAHQREIDELNSVHRGKIEQSFSRDVQHAKEINEQLSTIQRENKMLKHQLENEQSKSTQLNIRLVNVSEDASIDKKTKTELQISLEEANDRIKALEQKLCQLETGLTSESDLNTLEKAERMITVLRSENIKLATQLDYIKTNSIATIERLTDKSDQAITRLKELESQLSLEIKMNSSAKEERIKLKEQIELMKHNQTSTFERLTNSAEKAKLKVKELEQQLAEVNRSNQ